MDGGAVFLNQKRIDECIAWLMEKGSPPMKYLTGKHLLKMKEGSPELAALRNAVEDCADAREIFATQEADGSWCSGGSWAMKPSYLQKGRAGGYDPDSPKYVTANWVLPLLGDMGLTIADPRVRRASEYIFSYRGLGSRDRVFNDPSFIPGPGDGGLCCRFFQSLAALGKVGLGSDPRVGRGLQAVLRIQRDDGGWASEACVQDRKWTRSCPFSSYHAALALYSSGNPEYRESLIRALEFLLWHLGYKTESQIGRFFFHGHSTVHELLMFSELKVGLASTPVKTMLSWLKGMYRPDEGYFRNEGKPVSRYSLKEDGMDSRVAKYRLYHLAEDEWLTYYAARIATNLI